jgi:hypothetical protein
MDAESAVPVDLADLAIEVRTWLPGDDEPSPAEPTRTWLVSQRFIEAAQRGELTAGGMAEAGWFHAGWIADGGGPVLIRTANDKTGGV